MPGNSFFSEAVASYFWPLFRLLPGVNTRVRLSSHAVVPSIEGEKEKILSLTCLPASESPMFLVSFSLIGLVMEITPPVKELTWSTNRLLGLLKSSFGVSFFDSQATRPAVARRIKARRFMKILI